MNICGEYYPTLSVFPHMMTVPDCVVKGSNKLGTGHGEAKLYISSKTEMYDFYGGEGFTATCFMSKRDLIDYMAAIRNEYFNPSQEYAGKDELPKLWSLRMAQISTLDDFIFFNVYDQNQIAGPRGYVNSKDLGYDIIRSIALPLVSYIYVEKVGDEESPIFYWKLFVDFEAIWEKQNGPLVFNYRKEKEQEQKTKEESVAEKTKETIRQARNGQGKYREKLLEQCRFCPITMISDERLLIASHIKPWASCDDIEKIDPYNGYMLSPMIDKLFDQGYITFTPERHLILSPFISNFTWKQVNLKNNTFYQNLPMDEKRIEYLDFHHHSVFKGTYQE